MTENKIYVNVCGSRPAIMTSKIATRTSMNAVKKFIVHFLKVQHLNSQGKWRMLESGNLLKVKTKWNILGLLKINKTTMENIYIWIVPSLNICKEIIGHLACYKIYVWCQTQILFMHSWNKPKLIWILHIVSNWTIITWMSVYKIMCIYRWRHWEIQCKFVYFYFCIMYYYKYHDYFLILFNT